MVRSLHNPQRLSSLHGLSPAGSPTAHSASSPPWGMAAVPGDELSPREGMPPPQAQHVPVHPEVTIMRETSLRGPGACQVIVSSPGSRQAQQGGRKKGPAAILCGLQCPGPPTMRLSNTQTFGRRAPPTLLGGRRWVAGVALITATHRMLIQSSC